ncbi:PVC-type heme-binding CxxCH protein [Pollutibacter soli]|uniref:PVC-type heme-binding CxxCH protein n=1 Tax=Pollutibacter soli TaxID=3034157 RepID=UPI0030133EDD
MRLPQLLAVTLFSCLLFSNCKTKDKQSSGTGRLEILFLGHDSKHHESTFPAEQVARELFNDGINLSYTSNPDDLNKENLDKYDALVLYANYDSITDGQAKALLDFVNGGKGFIPVHCASWCFRNNPEVVELIGGQFKTHGVDSFPSHIIKPEHPAVKGLQEFTTWDETYVHDKISKNIEVLMERVDSSHKEPYTWVRNYGKGRVFYTAYGHDDKTWKNPGFLQLLKGGILWALGEDANARLAQVSKPKLTFTDAIIPNYEKVDPPPQFQAPLPVDQSMALIQVPVGFELKLFASEPQIRKPIYMNWDHRGRLWVVETVDYPNTVKDDQSQGDDRISILEDTNGDGQADKFTVFADKLNIPTSFTFYKDGIIVSQAPHFLYLRDTDGDDKADKRENLITGWGVFDTHAGPSNLKYGYDNQIWGVLGYSGFNGVIGSNPDTMKFSQGVYHFTPDGKNLEFLGNTSNNTWGLGFSEENDVFISTANNTHSAFYAIPKTYYNKVAGMNETGIEKLDGHYAMHAVTKHLRQVDVHNGFTAAAGHNLYTARNFPKEYWNRIAFVCEPTGRVIHNAIMEKSGSGFKEKDGWNLLASSDNWVGPVQAEVGPDGDVWILDWYNFIIQHNPTPVGFDNGKGNAYINPMRDTTRGRIYKLVYTGGKESKPLSLDKKDSKGLIKALSNDNMFWRLTAQRLLVENADASVLKDLYDVVRNSKADEIGVNAAATHALWTIHGLGALDGKNADANNLVIEALKNPSAGVRKAAIQVLPADASLTSAFLSSGVLNDKDLRVRLAAILKTADFPANPEIGKTLFTLAEQPENANDKWIAKALFIAGSVQSDGFMEAYRAKGLSEDAAIGQANLMQRIAMRSRLSAIQLSKWNNVPVGRAPEPKGKEILFSSNLDLYNKDRMFGMVIAQGDKNNGYAFYVEDGKLKFLVNQNGKSTQIATKDPLPQKFNAKAKLLNGGVMQILIDDKIAAEGKTKGLITADLAQGIRVGFDNKKGNERPGTYPEDFNFGGYINDASLELLAPGGAAVADLGPAAQTILLRPIQNAMKFDKTKLSAKAGTVIEIVFDNIDFMQHNFLLLKPGSLEKVGAAADKLASDPNGAEKQYVPAMPEVLYSTPLVNPEGKFTLKFKVPDTKGDYPYICSFPGHWRIMQGVLTVN